MGYTPEYIGFAQAGPALNEAFASGAIDVTAYGDMPAFTARSKGVDIKAIAVVNSAFPTAIIAGSKSGAASVTDLKGKRIAVPFGTPLFEFLEHELALVGLTSKDVQCVNTATDGPTMMESGQVDAVVSIATTLYALEAKGIGTVITSSNDGALRSVYMLFGRSAFLEENPECAEALVRAVKRAHEFAASNPDQAYKDLVIRDTTEDIIRKVYDDAAFASFAPEFWDQAKKGLAATADYMAQAGVVSSRPNPDEAIDTQYLDRVLSA